MRPVGDVLDQHVGDDELGATAMDRERSTFMVDRRDRSYARSSSVELKLDRYSSTATARPLQVDREGRPLHLYHGGAVGHFVRRVEDDFLAGAQTAEDLRRSVAEVVDVHAALARFAALDDVRAPIVRAAI